MIRDRIIRFVTGFTIFVLVSASQYNTADDSESTFSCLINDRSYQKQNLKATMQTITGGHTQVSLSHKPFSSFFFNDPEAGSRIELGKRPNRKAVIHYRKSRAHQYSPKDGFVKITDFDKQEKIISGRFEMTLQRDDKKGKTIQVSEGRFVDVPVVKKGH